MKKVFHVFSYILLFSITIWGCSDSGTNSSDPSDPQVNQASSQKQFVWNAMNYWYFWQEDVPELADNKAFFDNEQAFQNFLINFSSTEALYEDLIFSQEDDFSFFIEDFEEFNQQRQGISQDFGFEFGLVRFNENGTEIFGYVQYVLEDTPADEAGLTRGDIFTGINGTALTVNNFSSLLSNPTIELTLAESNDGQITDNGETVTVNSAQIVEDPIFLSRVIETGSSKVGYLLYNAFQANSHQNLNDVFGNFTAEGIDELVLDLRYNGGGAVITSAVLASMISGLGGTETFAVFTHNSKRSERNDVIPFLEQVPILDEDFTVINQLEMNSLSLDRLFVLTGFGTASASEAVINGLNPFMEVILIGRQTVGKDDASLTLYDTGAPPYTNRENANPAHKNAIQPIVLKIQNAVGESNGTGFIPQNPLNEITFLVQNGDLPPIGNENEPLFAKALELISGEPLAKSVFEPFTDFRGEFFKDSRDLEQFGKEMYILPEK